MISNVTPYHLPNACMPYLNVDWCKFYMCADLLPVESKGVARLMWVGIGTILQAVCYVNLVSDITNFYF